MNSTDLPPLPSIEAKGPEVCAVMRIYLGVWDDLSPLQARRVSAHLMTCADCSREQRAIKLTTQMVGSLEPSEPSARVDQAVMAAIAARTRGGNSKAAQPLRLSMQPQRRKRKPLARVATLVAAAAVIVLVVLASFSASRLFGGGGLPGGHGPSGPGITGGQQASGTAFSIPANVSWDNYVLYQTQSMADPKGGQYIVTSNYNMADGSMNVKTVSTSGKLVVDMISDGHKALGLDWVHHVAQWGADSWGVDESMFNLKTLRSYLQSGKATYLGKKSVNGQQVHEILYPDKSVLLLDMNYMPVNAFENVSSTSKPMYDTLRFLLPAQVPDSTWNMTLPPGFKWGTLPTKPQMQ
ncbi:MAG TPA: zf-HC2 domain-containing protein [Ktedonobacteraceae bacterium]|nr:zf-HC2 domain-containing protein [Ktedonobacteraceae bacterium]